MNISRLLTASQAAGILKINENTLSALAGAGQIPHIRVPATANSGPQTRFNTFDITEWLKQGPALAMNDQAYIERWQRRLEKQFPEQLAALREYDKRFTAPRKPKGYNLTKVKNKKLGFVYHVRYMENGKLVPTRWSTHTSDLEAAKEFAVCSREKLLSEYRQRKARQKNPSVPGLYGIMKKFYEKDSSYFREITARGWAVSEAARRIYYSSIINCWIPFCKTRRVKSFDDIDTPMMVLYQDYCLARGVKPQTVNHSISFVNIIFEYLTIRGKMKVNPCIGLPALKVKEENIEIRGCYNVKELRGVFNKRWKDEESYLLCLTIYSTGMRNSEMDRAQVKDIIQIKNRRFISISKSKTRYGARMVPLHDFVYAKLARHIKKTGKGPEDPLFCQENGKPLPRRRYTDANTALGMLARQDKTKPLTAEQIKEKLEAENITFYSGRHFWKTLMNAHELGEVEEYFMGHKVSSDVAKRYNHRDKQGQEKIAAKAGEVFKILDRNLFIGSP